MPPFLASLLIWTAKLQTLGLCAACREALKSSGNQGLIDGLAWSVVLLVSVPLTMVTVFATVVSRAMKKQKALQRAKAAAELEAARLAALQPDAVKPAAGEAGLDDSAATRA